VEITYDAQVNAAYVTLGGEARSLKTIVVNDVVLLDFDADGVLHGIELLDARRQLGIGATSTIAIAAGGQSVTLSLVATE
jgi:uncharacterized protein YuzE